MVATVPTFYKQTARLFFCETLGILKNTRIFGRRGVDTTSSIKTLGSMKVP